MTRTRAQLGTLLLVAVTFSAGCRPAGPTKGAETKPGAAKAQGAEKVVPTLSVFVPCGLTGPFHEAFAVYEAANTSVFVNPRYDNDAALLKLVRDEGKRPDLFVSPGGRELAVLTEKGLVDAAGVTRVGSFRIVAVVRRDWPGKVARPSDLAGEQVRSIALPDPDNSSIGWHVRQSLTTLGVWQQVAPRIRSAGRIIEAYQTVLQGQADLTFTYRGCPLPKSDDELAKSKARIAFELPVGSYDQPQVAIGVLKTTTHFREAQALLRFLGSEAVARQMVAQGLPDERRTLGAARPGAAPGGPASSVEPGKVVLVAFFPDDAGHRDVRAFLAGLPARFPGRLTLEIHNFRDPTGDPDGFRKWQRAGFGCAGILINGKNSFTLGSGKTQREVRFQRKMNVQWTQQELLGAIAQELGQKGAGKSDG